MQPTRIEKWSVVSVRCSETLPPEVVTVRLSGEVNGSPIVTEPIIGVGEGDGVVACAPVAFVRGAGRVVPIADPTSYLFGAVDPAYEQKFPGAREKLLESIRSSDWSAVVEMK